MVTQFHSILRKLPRFVLFSAFCAMLSLSAKASESTPNTIAPIKAHPTALVVIDNKVSSATALDNAFADNQVKSLYVLQDGPATESNRQKGKEGVIMVYTKDGSKDLDTTELGPNSVIIINGEQASRRALSLIPAKQIVSISTPNKEHAKIHFGKMSDLGVIYVKTKSPNKQPLAVNPDTMPRFEGGNITKFRSWVGKNLFYPPQAHHDKIEGRVMVGFTIERDGRLSDIRVMQSASPILEKVAIYIISGSPRWTPGMDNGKAVRVRYTFPIDFKL